MKIKARTITVNSNYTRWVALLLSVMMSGVFCLLGLAPSHAMADVIPDANNTTISPEDYVRDDAKILTTNTKIMVAGLNVKYSGLGGIKLVFVTKPGAIPNGEDIDTYKTELFNQLGVGDAQNNKGIMLLLMPDARKYAVEIGDGIQGDARDALSTDYIGDDSSAYNLLHNNQWNAAAKTMIALTDQRVSDSLTGNTVIKKTVKPMTAAESTAKAKADTAAKDKATAITHAVLICVALVGLLVLLAFGFAYNVKLKEKAVVENNRKRLAHVLDDNYILRNPGVDADVTNKIIDELMSTYLGDSNDVDEIMRIARDKYEKLALRSAVAGESGKTYANEDYYDYLDAENANTHDSWWVGNAIVLGNVLKDADTWIEDKKAKEAKQAAANAKLAQEVEEFKKKHADALGDDFNERKFQEDVREHDDWMDRIDQLGTAAWLWSVYNTNTASDANAYHSSFDGGSFGGGGASSDWSPSSSSDDDSSSSSFSGGFGGGFSSGGGGFSGSF